MSTGSHPLMKSHEVAQALRLSHATIRSWSAHGGGPIKPVKIGGRVFWKREEVDCLVAGGSR